MKLGSRRRKARKGKARKTSGKDPQYCIRLALKCFYDRLRGGFNGRLRGFRWIISGAG